MCMSLLGSIVKPLVLDAVATISDLFYHLSLYYMVKMSILEKIMY